jgi:hypothetical protein
MQVGEEYSNKKHNFFGRQPQLQQPIGGSEGTQHASTAVQCPQQTRTMLQSLHAGQCVYPSTPEATASNSASSSCLPKGLWATPSVSAIQTTATAAGLAGPAPLQVANSEADATAVSGLQAASAAAASDQPLAQQAAGPSASVDTASDSTLPLHEPAQPITTAEVLASAGLEPDSVMEAAPADPAAAAAGPAVRVGATSAGAQHGDAAHATGTGAICEPAHDPYSNPDMPQDQPRAKTSAAIKEYGQDSLQAAGTHMGPIPAEEHSSTATTPGSPESQQPAELSGLSAGQLFEAMYNLTSRLEGWPAQLWVAAGWSPPKAAPAAPAAPSAPAAAICESHGSFWEPQQLAAVGAEHSTPQQDAAAGVQPALQAATGSYDIPPGALVTPQLIIDAYNRAGVLAWAAGGGAGHEVGRHVGGVKGGSRKPAC